MFARKLTFPEPVIPANFHEMRQRVITGPYGHPGASMVEYEDGHQQSLVRIHLNQTIILQMLKFLARINLPSSNERL